MIRSTRRPRAVTRSSTAPSRAARSAAPALILIPALLAAACGSSDSSTSTTEGPARAESLTVAVAKDTGPLNIFAGASDQMTELVYDKLLSPSPYVADPQPWLATDVRQVDPTTWEVDLRDDVTWHDGEAFTADDVAFSFHYMHAAPTGRFTHHVNDTPSISTVEATSPTSVRFVCDYACPELGTVTLADLPVLPEHVWSKVDPATAKEVTDLPIGTGPFELVDYSPTTGYRFEANADYFAGAPTVDELVMPVIADSSAAFTALSSGQVDAVDRALTPELVDQFTASNDIGTITVAPLTYPELKLNFTREPFAQNDFRAALNFAVDRDQMLDIVGLGQGRPGTQGYVHPDAPFADPDASTPYDPAQATALLDSLGWKDIDGDGTRENPAGEDAPFTLIVNGGDAPQVRAAELIAEDFAEVGIDVVVSPLDAGSLSDASAKKNFDLYVTTNSPHAVADSTQFIMSHRSGNLWSHPDLAYPEFDALYEKWRATETNESRIAAMQEMQELFNRQPTAIALYYPDETWAFRADRFAGWVETPGYGIVHKWSFLPSDVVDAANAEAPQD
ncbi:peptide/nickel transport system substrate-binding protein [Rhodococcus sp. SMB37]|uniref:ABC transporter substrate-binding protein n=1 Tax=Rhodococcus sp. SMB37 TaxID=2512213 RepID=UPI001047827D|nr:ABC transporter substrate-binding protein [Rhodococcus sp. SMB37]TCN57197.1 peptide/nickel transport system substrate-binding protein [Rhodococcus sp. SMB37]